MAPCCMKVSALALVITNECMSYPASLSIPSITPLPKSTGKMVMGSGVPSFWKSREREKAPICGPSHLSEKTNQILYSWDGSSDPCTWQTCVLATDETFLTRITNPTFPHLLVKRRLLFISAWKSRVVLLRTLFRAGIPAAMCTPHVYEVKPFNTWIYALLSSKEKTSDSFINCLKGSPCNERKSERLATRLISRK